MAKTTIAELEQRVATLEDALTLALGRIGQLEHVIESIPSALENLKGQIGSQLAEIVEAAKAHKPKAKPAFGAGKKIEFTGTFSEAQAFAKANCARAPAMFKTQVALGWEHHIFFNR